MLNRVIYCLLVLFYQKGIQWHWWTGEANLHPNEEHFTQSIAVTATFF